MTDDSATVTELALAGLFHDIGKLLQRAGMAETNTDIEARYAPWNRGHGYYSHRHVLYTEAFLRDRASLFPDGVRPATLAVVAAGHHKPESAEQQIIRLADWASSGMDRVRSSHAQEGRYFEVSLRSVFDGLASSLNSGARQQEHRYELAPLAAPHWMPRGSVKLSREDYQRQYDLLNEDLQELEGLRDPQFELALDAVLERYLWAIPSSGVDADDVSLYDHSRTTGGFAATIARYLEDTGQEYRATEQPDWTNKHKPFLFVSGDLSGIQRYIFDIRSTERSAKVLRARSFELQLLAEQAAERILEANHLPRWCRLFASGGRFLLVLPNTRRTEQSLIEVRRELDSTFLEDYCGRVSLNVSAGVAAGLDDLKQERAGRLFERIRLDVQEAKQRKLQAALADEGHVLASIAGGRAGVCPSCGMRPATPEGFCKHCEQLVGYGQMLPKARRMSITRSAKSNRVSPLLWFDPQQERADLGVLYSQNAYEAGCGLMRTAFHLPTEEDGDVKDFTTIAGASRGEHTLAMLKADVDHLGWIFSRGLRERQSVSRYVTLSRMMDLFFTGHIGQLLDSAEQFGDVYTVFAGGDDLCLIGPWNVILDLAPTIRASLRRFAGEDNLPTISAGISLEKPDVPVGSMAERAERALEASKERRNRITAFGTTCDWNAFETALDAGKWLAELIEEQESISRSAVYRLFEIHRMRSTAERPDGEVPREAATWRSTFRYHLARNWPQEHRERLIELVENHGRVLPVALNYALYATRRGGDNE